MERFCWWWSYFKGVLMRLLYLNNKLRLPRIGNGVERFLHVDGSPEIDPTKYRKIQWLQSTGTQYIDTLIGFKDNTKLTIEVEYMYPDGGNYLGFGHHRCAFGQAGGKAAINGNVVSTADSTSNFVTVKVVQPAVPNAGHSALYTAYINDEYFGWFQWEPYDYATYLLFAMAGWDGAKVYQYVLARIRRCKIYEDDVLVKDLIPVIKKDLEEPMFYDIINKTEHRNEGYGDFIIGE